MSGMSLSLPDYPSSPPYTWLQGTELTKNPDGYRGSVYMSKVWTSMV